MNLRPSMRASVAIALVAILFSAAAYVTLGSPARANPSPVPSRFTVNGRTFGITYVATNQSEWESGLMNRKVTGSTTMLFIFPDLAIRPFWMYQVNTSLDIIWLNATGGSGSVVYIAADVPGCPGPSMLCPNYAPSSPANYLVEAKGGFAEANGVDVGTVFQFA